MKIDISFLQRPSVVIWCRTKEEAAALMDNVRGMHPIIDRDLPPKIERFDLKCDCEGIGFRFNRVGNGYNIGYSTMDYYREYGYHIVELNDIIESEQDFGDIRPGYVDIDAAFSALF